MSILQQVGCRYVTKFYTNSKDGTPRWEANVPYEALVCVTYKYGVYVSRIPVPADAGSPSDNPKYWAEFPNPAMGAWEELKIRLKNEIRDRKDADADLLDKLNKEIERATTAENAERDRATQAESDLSDRINAEVQRATNAENDLSGRLNAEVQRASGAEANLSGSITNVNNTVNNMNNRMARTLQDIVNKFYGGGTINADGSVSWGQAGQGAVGNINLFGTGDGSKKIATHDGTAEDDVLVN